MQCESLPGACETVFHSEVQDQEPEQLSGEWKTAAWGWLDKVKTIPLCKRIYQDETPIYANETPKKGQGQTHLSSAEAVCEKVHTASVRQEGRCAALGLVLQKR